VVVVEVAGLVAEEEEEEEEERRFSLFSVSPFSERRKGHG
jgi:hypothetical protein